MVFFFSPKLTSKTFQMNSISVTRPCRMWPGEKDIPRLLRKDVSAQVTRPEFYCRPSVSISHQTQNTEFTTSNEKYWWKGIWPRHPTLTHHTDLLGPLVLGRWRYAGDPVCESLMKSGCRTANKSLHTHVLFHVFVFLLTVWLPQVNTGQRVSSESDLLVGCHRPLARCERREL